MGLNPKKCSYPLKPPKSAQTLKKRSGMAESVSQPGVCQKKVLQWNLQVSLIHVVVPLSLRMDARPVHLKAVATLNRRIASDALFNQGWTWYESKPRHPKHQITWEMDAHPPKNMKLSTYFMGFDPSPTVTCHRSWWWDVLSPFWQLLWRMSIFRALGWARPNPNLKPSWPMRQGKVAPLTPPLRASYVLV